MNNTKPKILLVLSRSLSSSDGGREALIIDFIKRMHAYFDISTAVFNSKSEPDQEIIANHKKLGVTSTLILHKTSLGSIARNLLTLNGAIQEAFFFSKDNLLIIEKFVRSENISAVYFDMIRLFRYAEEINKRTSAKIIFDLDDLLSLRYELFSKTTLTPRQVFGTYGDFIPKIFTNILIGKVLPYILRYEAKMCRLREKAVAEFSDIILITSPSEKSTYQEFTSRQHNIFTNFPIISAKELSLPLDSAGEKELVWLGNNHVAHNMEALEHLISRILPKAKGFSLIVAGKTPHHFVERHQNNEMVSFVGFIPCKDSFFRPGKILISPFKFGTGIKIKLLEAMSAGVAVITNDTGFQGIPKDNNIFFAPCSSDEEMIERASKLASSQNYISDWIREQQSTLKTHFSHSHEKDIFLAISDNSIERTS
ncbi:glycosyltransferase family 4 protein [Metapseudomonas boanensis]|uniref:Glycosyltransferase family 4 protein n=1 Tax=Metapseudomonas boanensis TaxID=2822138 RepID=A0ABS5XDM1_9GAMM|nr:glycosyltransferase [Pseudomonas boanensis]MBT8765775.1 glycosyltransferase family 4 protein [Pseudomonas boanensis]